MSKPLSPHRSLLVGAVVAVALLGAAAAVGGVHGPAHHDSATAAVMAAGPIVHVRRDESVPGAAHVVKLAAPTGDIAATPTL